MAPGYLVLERLFWMASGPEKGPIMDALEEALNERSYSRLSQEEEGSARKLLALPDSVLARRPSLARFAEIANAVISTGDEIDPAVMEIFESWVQHRRSLDPRVREAFEDAARFLRVALIPREGRPRHSKKSVRSGPKMAKYRVILPVAFDDGVRHEYGETVELDIETAKEYAHALITIEAECEGQAEASNKKLA
jgi:hypothetical protein